MAEVSAVAACDIAREVQYLGILYTSLLKRGRERERERERKNPAQSESWVSVLNYSNALHILQKALQKGVVKECPAGVLSKNIPQECAVSQCIPKECCARVFCKFLQECCQRIFHEGVPRVTAAPEKSSKRFLQECCRDMQTHVAEL